MRKATARQTASGTLLSGRHTDITRRTALGFLTVTAAVSLLPAPVAARGGLSEFYQRAPRLLAAVRRHHAHAIHCYLDLGEAFYLERARRSIVFEISRIIHIDPETDADRTAQEALYDFADMIAEAHPEVTWSSLHREIITKWQAWRAAGGRAHYARLCQTHKRMATINPA